MTEIYFVQNIDNSRVVRVADPRRRREQQIMLAAVGIVFLFLFGYTWQNYRMMRLGYQTETVRKQEASLRQWNRELRLEEAALRDPTRIYQVAENQLGLGSAQPGQLEALAPAAPAGTVDEAPVLAENHPIEKGWLAWLRSAAGRSVSALQ